MSVINLTKDNFEEVTGGNDRPVLVDFWAPWCGYCRRIAPAVDQLAEEHETLCVGKVNIDEEPELGDRFGVDTIPTLLLFKEGKIAGQPLVAPQAKAEITGWLKENAAL